MNTGLYIPTLVMGVIAAVGDFVVPTILGRWYPNYSVIRDTISELGTEGSPVRRQASAWLILLGVLFVGFGVGQGVQFTEFTAFHWLYVLGIVAFGVGAGIVAGIWPEDPKGVEETPSGKVHGIGAGLGFILLMLNPLWALGIHELNGLEWWNLGFFLLGVVTFALFLISEDRDSGVLSLSGLWQRLNLLMIYSPLLVNYMADRLR